MSGDALKSPTGAGARRRCERAGPGPVPRRDRRVRRAPTPAASTSPATREATERTRALVEALGRAAFEHDIPAGIEGIDVGARLPVPAGAAPRRRGLGRAAELVPDQRRLAGKPRRLPRAAPRRHARRGPAQRPLEHRRRDHPRRARAGVRRARARRGARRRPLPDPRVARRGARPGPGRGRRAHRLAHLLRRRRRRRRARGGRPRARRRRWSSTRPGARTCASRRCCPRARWSAAPTSSSPRSTSSSAASPSRRSSTSAADGLDRRGRRRPLRDADRVDEPERPAHRLARRRPPAGRGRRGRAARRDDRGRRAGREPRSARYRGSTCSTSASWAARACTAGTRCGSSVDVRGTGSTGTGSPR